MLFAFSVHIFLFCPQTIDCNTDGGIIAGDDQRSLLLAVYDYLRENGCCPELISLIMPHTTNIWMQKRIDSEYSRFKSRGYFFKILEKALKVCYYI